MNAAKGLGPSQQILDWLDKVLSNIYSNKQRTFEDVAATLQCYNTLRPRTEIYSITQSYAIEFLADDVAYEDGLTQLLLLLHGTIPITFRSTVYQIPMNIWLPVDYPRGVPLCFVVPTAGMQVRPGNYVDIDKRCYHPYLAHWSHPSSTPRVVELIDRLQEVFSREPPVIAIRYPPQILDRPGKYVNSSSPLRPNAHQSRPPTHASPPPRPAKLQVQAEVAETGKDVPQDRQQSNLGTQIVTANGLQALTNRPPPPIPQPVFRNWAMDPNDMEHSQRIGSSRHSTAQPVFATGIKTTPVVAQEIRSNRDWLTGEIDSVRASCKVPEKPSNPERQSLIATILEAIQDRANDSHNAFLSQLKLEDNYTQELRRAEQIGHSSLEMLKHTLNSAKNNCNILMDRIQKASSIVKQVAETAPFDIDEHIVAQNILYNQLYDLVAEEMAQEDTIYALGRALENERIDLDLFLKHVKLLARDQFMQRALIIKICQQLGLEY